MSNETSRLTELSFEASDADQRSVWERIMARSGDANATRPARLPGPYEAWVRRPALAHKAAELGEEFRFHSVLSPALRELAILQTAAHWRANYVFYAHSRLGKAAGLTDAQIAEVREEHNLVAPSAEERAVGDVTAQLLRTSRVDDATYDAAVALLGEAALVDLVGVVGFYCMAAFTINAFQIPLPEGVAPFWP